VEFSLRSAESLLKDACPPGSNDNTATYIQPIYDS